MQHKYGSTRHVFLIKRYVIKFPQTWSWKHFLLGLLANLGEVVFYKAFKSDKRFCPIIWWLPGGFLLVMKRAEPLSREEFYQLDYKEFIKLDGGKIPVENKLSSFGKMDGDIVAIDYN